MNEVHRHTHAASETDMDTMTETVPYRRITTPNLNCFVLNYFTGMGAWMTEGSIGESGA